MNVGETEVLGEFFISNGKIHVRWKRTRDVIIDVLIGLLITVKERWNDGNKGDNENWENVDDEFGGFVKSAEDGFVVELDEGFVEGEDEGWENSNRTNNAKNDAFGHDETKVEA